MSDNLIPNDREASFANIVQATVVETSARSVRDPSIGSKFECFNPYFLNDFEIILELMKYLINSFFCLVATISSITVGVIAILAFGLLIFLALAARRRRIRREKDNIIGKEKTVSC